jgi:hypothetical protein
LLGKAAGIGGVSVALASWRDLKTIFGSREFSGRMKDLKRKQNGLPVTERPLQFNGI